MSLYDGVAILKDPVTGNRYYDAIKYPTVALDNTN